MQNTEPLMRVLYELYNCRNESCTLRTSGVKHDFVSRIMEHLRRIKIFVLRDVKQQTRDANKEE